MPVDISSNAPKSLQSRRVEEDSEIDLQETPLLSESVSSMKTNSSEVKSKPVQSTNIRKPTSLQF